MTTIVIGAAAGAVATALPVALIAWLWLRKKGRAENWGIAWETLDQQPAAALRTFELYAPKGSRPPKSPKKRPQYLQAKYGQAICHVRLHRPDAAEAALRDAAAYQPQPDELEQLCRAYLAGAQENVRPAALEAWARLLALPPETHSPETRAQAEEALQQQLQLQPDDSNERLEQLVGLLSKTIELAPKLTWARRDLGFALSRLGRLPEAVAAFDGAISQQPDQVHVYRALADAHRQLGNRNRLRDALRGILLLEPSAPVAYEAAMLCLEGDAPIDEKSRREEAKRLFLRATQLDPQHARAWLMLAREQWHVGERTAAVASVEKALAVDASLAEGFALLGEYQLALGDLAAARATLAKAYALDALSPKVLRQLGDLEFAEGNYADALQHYRRLETSGADVALADNLARCHLETGSPDAAVALLAGRKTLELPARLTLARSQGRLGNWAESLKTFQAARPTQQTSEWNYYYAAALAANRKLSEAEALFQQLLSEPAWKERARRQLGHIKLLQREAKSARELYRGQNGDTTFAIDLGRVSLLTGEPEVARRYFLSAADDPRTAPMARFGAACADAQLGDSTDLEAIAADGQFASDALEVIANRAFESRRYADALAAYERVIKGRKSVSSRILERLAAGYVHLRRDREALPHLVELLKRKPENEALRTNLALCRYRLARLAFSKSEWDAARRGFLQAHELLAERQPEPAAMLLSWGLESAYREALRILDLAQASPAQLKLAKDLCKFGCGKAPTEFRWQLIAGLVYAKAADFAASRRYFEAARALSPTQPQVLLGLAISQHEAGDAAAAQQTLKELLVQLDGAGSSGGEAVRVTARFALAMATARQQLWTPAAEALAPLLTHPLVASSKKLTPRDVAQVALAYYAAGGNKETAGELAKKYLPDMKGLSDVLIGLVQADAKDFAGAAATLGRAYNIDHNPKVLKVLVGCVLAVAAQAVMKGDLKTASDSVSQALRYDAKNKEAKSLHDALSLATSLKSLNLAQLDEAIATCHRQFMSDKSPDVVRSLANLLHRKAVQAERSGRAPDDMWNECFQFWQSNIFQNQQFWPRFAETYNAGRSRREQLKDEELNELRGAVPGQLAEVHTAYAKDYRKDRQADGLVRHLNLIWRWQPGFKSSDEFLATLVNVQEMDESLAEMLERASTRLTNTDLRNLFRKRLAIYWYNTGGAVLMEIIEDMKAGRSWGVQDKGRRAKAILTRAYNLDPSDSDIRELYNLANSKF